MSDEAMDDGAFEQGAAGPSGPAAVSGGPRRTWVVALICLVLPAALLTAVIVVPAALYSRPRLDAAGNAPAGATILAVLGIGLIRLGWVAARNRTPPSPAGPSGWRRPTAGEGVGFISFGLWIMATSAAFVTYAVLPSPVRIAVAAVGPLLLAGLADYLLRRYAGLGTADRERRSSLGLRVGERAVWTGRAQARWRSVLAWPLVVLVGPDLLSRDLTTAWRIAVTLVAVFLLAFTSVRVTVAARGVTVRYGLLRLRLTRIPLRRIASAEAVERDTFGFGLPLPGQMLAFGSSSVVLRSGPALHLTLRDGKTFTVTVDDAATGAALLNDLIAGAEGASGP
jgi:hypothetical protein